MRILKVFLAAVVLPASALAGNVAEEAPTETDATLQYGYCLMDAQRSIKSTHPKTAAVDIADSMVFLCGPQYVKMVYARIFVDPAAVGDASRQRALARRMLSYQEQFDTALNFLSAK